MSTEEQNDFESYDNESDAQILWNDVCDLLSGEGLPPSTLAMFRSCIGLEINEREDNSELVIGIGSRFIQRNINKNLSLIKSALERAAFEPMELTSRSINKQETPKIQTTISPEELELLKNNNGSDEPTLEGGITTYTYVQEKAKKTKNPLVEKISAQDSMLTFETFIEGSENQYALQAAKNVANGSRGYNPLFIYGNSGLGKTHLLRAIQNYIYDNDSNRQCVYKQGTEFVRDYSTAMRSPDKDVRDALSQNYQNIDVLIIDDIQGIKSAAGTVNFFFDTFNTLMREGKQIILAADETPSQIGFEERVSSRLDSGVTIAIQTPNYELKLNLIRAFYERMKRDGEREGSTLFTGTISDENLEYMAKKAGSNIRTIKSFCNSCLLLATRREQEGLEITKEDINKEAAVKWGLNQRTFTVDQIQRYIEQNYNISHADLISNKRNKSLMEPRHIGVWLSHELTDSTLAYIGDKFGGRTHATVKHSIWWVEDQQKKSRTFYEKTKNMKEALQSTAE